ncbi:MAG: AAA family ATPase [Deltaproteobacteria bacterium]|nr:AAA family ATPase [Deltaproteobacteria bacterium]
MTGDPAFADAVYPDPPDRLLRDDELNDDFIEAVGEVGQSLAIGRTDKISGQREKAARNLFNDVGKSLRAGGIPRPKWLVNRLIECGFIQLFGPTGTMKSFVAMLLSYAIVTGKKFFGRATESGPVVYICGEGRAGAWRRFAALVAYFEMKVPDSLLFLSNRAVNLDAATVDTLRSEIESATAAAGRPPVLIVIDTLARSIVGDENSSQDMSEFVNAVDEISAEFGCSVILIHHTGHSPDAQNRGRGSSVLDGACDSIIKCADQTLTWKKTKDSELPDPIRFAFKKVDLDVDEDGKVIDSIVIVEPEEGVAPRVRHMSLKRPERLALETLIEISARGELRDGLWWAELAGWRDEFNKRHWGDNRKAKNMAHKRSRESLVAMGLASVENDCYSVIRPEDAARVQDLVTIGPIIKSIPKTGNRQQTATNGNNVADKSATNGNTPL